MNERHPNEPPAGQGQDAPGAVAPAVREATATWQPPPPGPTDSSVHALRELLGQSHHYDAAELHARGGMGVILRARDRALGRTVAMKVLQRAWDTPDGELRFIDEARITGRLEHPNIVPVHAAGLNEQGEVFYTMKFVRGTTLRQVIDQLRERDVSTADRYPLAILLTIFQKACDAVAFAHSRGVLHRDLKPDNLMLGDYGEVLVMDWGLAKVVGQPERRPSATASDQPDASLITSARNESGESATLAGTVMGTPRHMAPEQARGEVEGLDARCDVYALGTILFELLTLRPAVPGETSKEILANAISGRIETIPGDAFLPHCPGGRVPTSLAAVAGKAMSLRREDRYASVTDLQAEITRYQSGFATAAEGAGFGKQVALLIKRNRGIAATSFVAWLVITALAGWFVTNVTRERDRAEGALTELRNAAPTYLAQARTLFAEQKPEEALNRLDTALRLNPDDADAHLQRAHTLQVLQRLPAAAASYERVLDLRPDDKAARMNLDLCHASIQALARDEAARPRVRAELLAAVIAQGRTADLWPLQRSVGENRSASRSLIESRLRAWTAQPAWPTASGDDRLRDEDDGTFSLMLEGLEIVDLTPLQGLPLSVLMLPKSTHPIDLAPLAGLPLRRLKLTHAVSLRNIAPLAGLPLMWLDMRDTAVADLSPLAHCPKLAYLHLSHCPVTDLRPLQALPLRALFLDGAPVKDLSPLAAVETLETILLPGSGSLPGLETLRGLPRLKRISARWDDSIGNPAQTAIEFWAEHDAQKRP